MTNKQKTIADAPAMLNTNDKAMWVIGWNECLAAHEQARVVGEPVAYLVTGPYEKVAFADFGSASSFCKGLNKGFGEAAYSVSPLYASPPAPQEAQAIKPPEALEALKAAFAADPNYAWSWHCAAWSSAYDEGMETGAANRAAARFMHMAFDVDTSKNQNFKPEHRVVAPVAQPATTEQAEAPSVESLTHWTPGANVFKDWCAQWFGPDSDDEYLGKAARDLLKLATQPTGAGQGEAPRNIIWDSLHPDYPVEWTNPGRPAREGEIHYIRYDLYSDAVHATQPTASNAGEREAIEAVSNDIAHLARWSPEGLAMANDYLGNYIRRDDVLSALVKARAALASKPVAPPARESEDLPMLCHLWANRLHEVCPEATSVLRAAASVLSATTPAPAGQTDIEAAAMKLAECMDYPWEHMTAQGRDGMRHHARSILRAARGDEVKPS